MARYTAYGSPAPPGAQQLYYAGYTGPAHLTMADLNALIPTLPTSLPATAGILWNDGGLLVIS
jgi:hypothetical protein